MIIQSILVSVTMTFANRTGTAARESLRRDCPVGLTSPVFHACGSASPFRARTLSAFDIMEELLSRELSVRLLSLALFAPQLMTSSSSLERTQCLTQALREPLSTCLQPLQATQARPFSLKVVGCQALLSSEAVSCLLR